MVLVVKSPPANAGDAEDVGSIPGVGRSPGEGNGNLLQYSRLEKFRGQRNLVGYSPEGHKVSDAMSTYVQRKEDSWGFDPGLWSHIVCI